MPLPEPDTEILGLVADQVKLRVGLNTDQADRAALAAFTALATAGYVIVPLPLIDSIRAQAFRDFYASQVPLAEIAAARDGNPNLDRTGLKDGGPFREAETLMFIAALGEDLDV